MVGGMRTGRPKKPESLNKLHGNPGKRKPKKKTFASEDSKFGIPHGLSQVVRQKVRKVAHYLEGAGAPIEFLRPMFNRYCIHLELAERAWKKLKKDGVVLGGKKHPANQAWKDNSTSALQIEGYFERVLKNTDAPEGVDELKEFLEKGGIRAANK